MVLSQAVHWLSGFWSQPARKPHRAALNSDPLEIGSEIGFRAPMNQIGSIFAGIFDAGSPMA